MKDWGDVFMLNAQCLTNVGVFQQDIWEDHKTVNYSSPDLMIYME